MAAAGRAGASDWLLHQIALILSLLDQRLHMPLVEAFLRFEARAERCICVAKHRHAVAFLWLESLAPSLFQHPGGGLRGGSSL
jgi:hypothetical protein